jgi:hypothetical protein
MSIELYCCLCLHSGAEVAKHACTVINGQAVCYEHMGYVQGGKFSAALGLVKREEHRE